MSRHRQMTPHAAVADGQRKRGYPAVLATA